MIASLTPFTNSMAGHPSAAVTNFFWDPPSPWGHSFGFWRHPMARCRSPYWSFRALIVYTVVSSLGTSRCSATVAICFGFVPSSDRPQPLLRRPLFPFDWHLSRPSPFLDRPPSLLGRLLSLFVRPSFLLDRHPSSTGWHFLQLSSFLG
jgi:hypothetical protein